MKSQKDIHPYVPLSDPSDHTSYVDQVAEGEK